MKFYISDTFTNGSGQEFTDKEAFLQELSLMIEDCENNGGTTFDITVNSDASCFVDDEEEAFIDAFYHDCSEEELRAMGCFDNLNEED